MSLLRRLLRHPVASFETFFGSARALAASKLLGVGGTVAGSQLPLYSSLDSNFFDSDLCRVLDDDVVVAVVGGGVRGVSDVARALSIWLF